MGRVRQRAFLMILALFFQSNKKSLNGCVNSWSPILQKTRRGEHLLDPFGISNTRQCRHHRPLSVSSAAIVQDVDHDHMEYTKLNGTFQITAPFAPAGDQPAAIQALVERIQNGDIYSVLRGCTGTGKTLVMAHVIANTQKPTLVLCHNKTLAAQLARELRAFLGPVVELFVSYYNHYRPEFYKETSGVYMGKKSAVNPDLDVLRHRATRALASRRNVVVVASVSCLFGLGLPKEYLDACAQYKINDTLDWDEFLEKLTQLQYRLSIDDERFERGQYQIINDEVSGSKVITLWPKYEKFPLQIQVSLMPPPSNSTVFSIQSIRQGSQSGFQSMTDVKLFPASHHVSGDIEAACESIEEEMKERVQYFHDMGNTDARNRLEGSVLRDLEQLRGWNYCKGIENYSRHLAGRPAGVPPETLVDYMRLLNGDDWLLLMDESHVTLPQLRSMFRGDQSRKGHLVKHGFRLPSALDNRPINEDEFWKRTSQTVFVSATPSHQELSLTKSDPIDMIIRPTFVCDPKIEIRPSDGEHLDDLIEEIKTRAKIKQGSLVITLTKRDAEDLASHLQESGVRCAYLHSGLKTVERSNALRALQMREIDCVVGINCLREGLDLPQISLVAVLNADSEGFLRSESALVQVIGRAARNIDGMAILYANRVTASMQRCIDLTAHRRQIQLHYNQENDCEMRSTIGSSSLSFFDLLKEQIDLEKGLVAKDTKNVATESVLQSTLVPMQVISLQKEKSQIVTDHIPTSPGVYLWKDDEGSILYIGKGVNLRSRVKSYISPNAKHGPRIEEMVRRAKSVDVVLTASERDALLLESNYIKYHQPPFNVLLKDDEHYPYICASIGDLIPSLTIAPCRKPENSNGSSRYRYFGPYTSFPEINTILEEIESEYDLRVKSFMTRQGSFSQKEYNDLFNKVLVEVFDESQGTSHSLQMRRRQYEEAGLLFDSECNASRDVITAQLLQDDSALVNVIQLRGGIMAGTYKYNCQVPAGLCQGDLASVVQTVLTERHYPAGEHSTSWFPSNILLSLPPLDSNALRASIKEGRSRLEPNAKGVIQVKTAATRGVQKEIDERTLEFAKKNVGHDSRTYVDKYTTPRNGELALSDLASLLALANPPSRIECYDISHTQGDNAVASRVVFLNGEPVPRLYRKFNIRTVVGVDDYASIEEVLERRFRHAFKAGACLDKDDPWAIPDLVVIDGGKGQLNAALKGISKAAGPAIGQNEILSLMAVCALAKDQEQVFVPGQSDPVNDRPDSPALLLLRALRDESHRFALQAHRKRRSILKSV